MRFCLCLLFLACLGCGPQDPSNATAANPSSANDTSQFYPLEPFLDQEISYVELRDFGLSARWKKGKQVHSTSLSKEQWADTVRQVKSFLDQFWVGHKDQFRENSFEDLGTERTVFDYTAKDSAYPLQQVTLQTDPRTQEIKSLYLVATEKNAFVGPILHRIQWQAQTRLQWVRWFKNQPDSLSETLLLDWKKAPNP